MVWSRTIVPALAACLMSANAIADTVLLEFTSPTCGPCREMRPVVQEVAAAGYLVREVDTTREPGLAAEYRVDILPMFIAIVDGQERARWPGGGKTTAQLIEMIRKSEEIASQAAAMGATKAVPGGAIDFVGTTTVKPGGANIRGMSTSSEPQPGRVVPMDAKPPVARTAASAEAGASSLPASTTVAGLIAATVRLNVEDPSGRSTGTGTIVDTRQGKALVLTCGHIFRESQGKGLITISLFKQGANGAELQGTADGTLVDYDLDRDLALVCFVPERPTAVAPIAPADTAIQPELPATSVGCEHGANPTPWMTRVTAVNRYQGHPNIEAAGAPVEGRSGGGLFNTAGHLIGVCNAADPQGNEGLYAGLDSIHQKLDSLGLSFVHQAPSKSGGTGGALPATGGEFAMNGPAASPAIQVRGQDPATGSGAPEPAAAITSGLANPFVQAEAPGPASQAFQVPDSLAGPAANVPPPSAVAASAPSAAAPDASAPARAVFSAEEQAALAEINRRGADAEVICIITPREQGARSEIIKLNRASPEFVQALGTSGAPPAASIAAGAGDSGAIR